MGLAGIEARDVAAPQDDGKDQRIQFLENKVAAMAVEIDGLPRLLMRFQHIENHIVETGRRVIP